MKLKSLLVFLLCFFAFSAIQPVNAAYRGSLVTTGDVGLYTSIAISSTDTPYISYFNNSNKSVYVIKCLDSSCITYAAPVLVAATGTSGDATSIAVGSDNLPMISYWNSTGGKLNTAKCTTVDCTAFTYREVDAGPGVGRFAAIALDANNIPTISYFDSNSGGRLKVARCSAADCSGSISYAFPDGGTGVGQHTSIAFGANGNPRISYYDQTNTQLKVLACNDAGCSSATPLISDNAADVGKYSDIKISSADELVVTYYDDSTDDLKMIYCISSDCSGVTPKMVDVNNDVGQYTSVDFARMDVYTATLVPTVSYYDVTNQKLKIARCTDVNCSSFSMRTLSGGASANEGLYSSLAVGADTNPLIAYYAATPSADLMITADRNHRPVFTNIGTWSEQTVNENQTLTFTPTTSDSDNLPANVLFFEGLLLPEGASVHPETGEFTWTPGESAATGPVNSFTNHTIFVFVGDGFRSSVQKVTIRVKETNETPQLVNVNTSYTIDELVAFSFDADMDDADINAQTPTFTLTSTPELPVEATFDTATGVFNMTPTELQGGNVYNMTLSVSDGFESVSQPITLTIAETNSAPTLVLSKTSYNVNEHVTVTFDANYTDSDNPADVVTFSLANLPTAIPAEAIDPATGVFNWTPAETDGGSSYTFDVVVNDNGTAAPGALTNSKQVTINVAETNSAPTISIVETMPLAVGEGDTTNVTFTAVGMDTDIPAQTLTYSLVGAILPEGATFDTATGAFSWSFPREALQSSYNFNVQVKDNGAGTLSAATPAPVTINITEVNVDPVIGTISAPATLNEHALLSFNIPVTDDDRPNQTITYSLGVGAPGGAVIDPNGTFNWTPSETQGGSSFNFTITATDAMGGSNTSSNISITVNETNTLPVVNDVALTTGSLVEGQTATFTIAATDTDDPVQALTYSLTGTPPNWVTLTGNTITLVIPTEYNSNSVNFGVRANDGIADGPIYDFNKTIVDSNVAPVITPVNDQLLLIGQAMALQVVATDADLPAQTLTYTVSSVPATNAVVGSSGVISWTAVGGTYTFTVTVSDGVATPVSDEFVVNVGRQLVENGGFEDGKDGSPTATIPANWTPSKLSKDKRVCGGVGNNSLCAFQFLGSATEASRILQTITANEITNMNTEKGVLILTADIKPGKPNPATPVVVVVKLTYTNTTYGYVKLKIPAGAAYVTRQAQLTLPTKNVAKARIAISGILKSGRYTIDNVSLLHVPATTGGRADVPQDGFLPLPPAQ